jgi:hypothetical protein
MTVSMSVESSEEKFEQCGLHVGHIAKHTEGCAQGSTMKGGEEAGLR